MKTADTEPSLKEEGEGCVGSLCLCSACGLVGTVFARSKSKLPLLPKWNNTSSHPQCFLERMSLAELERGIRPKQWKMRLGSLIGMRNCRKASDASPSFCPSFLRVGCQDLSCRPGRAARLLLSPQPVLLVSLLCRCSGTAELA